MPDCIIYDLENIVTIKHTNTKLQIINITEYIGYIGRSFKNSSQSSLCLHQFPHKISLTDNKLALELKFQKLETHPMPNHRK